MMSQQHQQQQQQQNNNDILVPESFLSAQILIRALRFVPENQLSLLLGREYNRINPHITVSAYFDGELYNTTPFPLYYPGGDQTSIYQFCDIDEEFYILFDQSELMQHPNPHKHRKGITFIVKLNPGGRELGKLLIKLNAVQPYGLDQGYQEFQLGHSSMRLGMEIRIMEVGDIPVSRVDCGRYKPQKQRMFVMSRVQEDQYYLQKESQRTNQNSPSTARPGSRQTSQDIGVPVPSIGRPQSAQQSVRSLQEQQQQESKLSYLRKVSPRSPRSPKSPRSDLFYLQKNQKPQEILIEDQNGNQTQSDVSPEDSDNSSMQNGVQDNRSFLQKVNPAFLQPFRRSKSNALGDQSRNDNNSESVDQQMQPDSHTAQSMAQFISLEQNNNNAPPRNTSPTSQQSRTNKFQPHQSADQPQNDHFHLNDRNGNYANGDAQYAQNANNARYANNDGNFQALEAQNARNVHNDMQAQIVNGNRSQQRQFNDENSQSQNENENENLRQYNSQNSGQRYNQYENLQTRNENQNQIEKNSKNSKNSKDSGQKQNAYDRQNSKEGSEFGTLGSHNSSPNLSNDETNFQRSTSTKNSETKLQKNSSSKNNNKKISKMVNAVIQASQKMKDQEVSVEILKPSPRKRDFWAQVQISSSPRSNSPMSSGGRANSQNLSKILPPLKNLVETGIQSDPDFQILKPSVNSETQVSTMDFVQQFDQEIQVETEPTVVIKEVEKIVPFVLYVKEPQENNAQNFPQNDNENQLENDNSHNQIQIQTENIQNTTNKNLKTPILQTELAIQDQNGEEFQAQESPKFIGEDFSRQDDTHQHKNKNNTNNNNNIIIQNISTKSQELQKYDSINYTEINVDSENSPHFIPLGREASVEGELVNYNEAITFDLSKIVNSQNQNNQQQNKQQKKHSTDFQFQVDTKNSQDQDDDNLNSQNQNQNSGIKSIFNSWRKKSTKPETRTAVTEPIPEISQLIQDENKQNNAQRSQSGNNIQNIQNNNEKNSEITLNNLTNNNSSIIRIQKINSGVTTTASTSYNSEGTVDRALMDQKVQVGTQNVENAEHVQNQDNYMQIQDVDCDSIVNEDSERFQSVGERRTMKNFKIIPVKKVSVGTDPMESLINQVKLNRWRVRRARERGVAPLPPALPPERLWSEKAQQYRAKYEQQFEYESQLTIENVRHMREKYGDEEEEEWEGEGKQQQVGSFKGSGKKGSTMNDDPMYLKTATRGRLIQPSDKIRSLSPQPQSNRGSFKAISRKGTGTVDDRTSNYSEDLVSGKLPGIKSDNLDNMSDTSGPVSLNHVEMSYEPREFPKHVPEWASIKLRRTLNRDYEVDIAKLEQEIADEEEGGVVELPDTVSTSTKTLSQGIHHSTPAHQITPKVLGEAIERRNKHMRDSSQASLLSTRSTVSLRRIQKEQHKKDEEDKTQLDGSLGWKVQALIGVFDLSKKGQN